MELQDLFLTEKDVLLPVIQSSLDGVDELTGETIQILVTALRELAITIQLGMKRVPGDLMHKRLATTENACRNAATALVTRQGEQNKDA